MTGIKGKVRRTYKGAKTMKYLLGIDYGTGGAKACITDEELKVLAYAFREYAIITTQPGWSEHQANNYWSVTCDLIQECLKKSKVDPTSIVAIATSAALPSFVMVDREGSAIGNAFNLMDRRAIKEIDYVKEKIGEKRILDLTANRLEDQPSLLSLLWVKNNRPEEYRRIHKIHTISSFIKYKLTGQENINYSEGPLYGLAYDIRNNRFEKDILDILGIDISILPSVVACDEVIGYVTKIASHETGLAVGTPVAGGQVDACAGWLGGGATKVGDIQMNLGTCGNFGVIHDSKDFMDSMINCAYTVDSKKNFVVIPTTTTGGQLIRYMRDQFSPLERAVEREAGISAYDLLNYEAEKVPAGCEGLIVLPYLMGERTPLWDVSARGVVFGLSLNHGKGHVVRAMMESVAFALYSSYELLKDKLEIINYPIVMNEGGAKSVLWRRIITNVFNVPTVLLKNRTGAPYGDCILAGKAVGVFKDFAVATEHAEYVEMMEPDQKAHEVYMNYHKLFKKLYTDLKDDFKELSVLREV